MQILKVQKMFYIYVNFPAYSVSETGVRREDILPSASGCKNPMH